MKPESVDRHRLPLSVLLVAIALILPVHALGQTAGEDAPKYKLAEGWPKLPSGMAWGGVISVDMDGDGNIVVFRRAEPPILKFAPSGEYLGGMGEGAIQRAHGFEIDKEGFLWATDQQGQQVIKFSPKGEVLMSIGKKGVAGDGPDTFSGPCDLTVTASGDIFVADGHGNSRVVKLAKDGSFVKAWGKKGAEPGDFNVPHSTAMDSQGRLFVADRSNNRIQIFDQDGKYLDSWTQFGSPSGLYISPDDTLYVADSGKGIAVGSARDGSVITLIEGTAPEGVTADAAGNVYAAEPTGEMLKKFVKQ
jgi:streptogramin lyase